MSVILGFSVYNHIEAFSILYQGALIFFGAKLKASKHPEFWRLRSMLVILYLQAVSIVYHDWHVAISETVS